MSRPQPAETAMKLTDAKQRLSQVVNDVARGNSRVVVEKNGLPVAAIISMDEYRRFREQELAGTELRAALFEKLARFSDAFAGIPDDELERELARAQAEVRAARAEADRG